MLTKEIVIQKLSSILTGNDSIAWQKDNTFNPAWCELSFRTNPHNTVMSFGFDEDGSLIPSGSSSPTLKTLALYNAAFNRAMAVIVELNLKITDL
jgi:hypothetical protein